jgi:hypothetical protein
MGVVQNNLSDPVNLQMGGGLVVLHNESLVDVPVNPGDTVIYSWLVPDDSGPGGVDMSTITYIYTSSVDVVGDVNAGLMGPLIIGRGVSSTSLNCKLECMMLSDHQTRYLHHRASLSQSL